MRIFDEKLNLMNALLNNPGQNRVDKAHVSLRESQKYKLDLIVPFGGKIRVITIYMDSDGSGQLSLFFMVTLDLRNSKFWPR